MYNIKKNFITLAIAITYMASGALIYMIAVQGLTTTLNLILAAGGSILLIYLATIFVNAHVDLVHEKIEDEYSGVLISKSGDEIIPVMNSVPVENTIHAEEASHQESNLMQLHITAAESPSNISEISENHLNNQNISSDDYENIDMSFMSEDDNHDKISDKIVGEPENQECSKEEIGNDDLWAKYIINAIGESDHIKS